MHNPRSGSRRDQQHLLFVVLCSAAELCNLSQQNPTKNSADPTLPQPMPAQMACNQANNRCWSGPTTTGQQRHGRQILCLVTWEMVRSHSTAAPVCRYGTIVAQVNRPATVQIFLTYGAGQEEMAESSKNTQSTGYLALENALVAPNSNLKPSMYVRMTFSLRTVPQ